MGAGLDPQDRVLKASYAAEVRRHLNSGPPPPAVLAREGAIPSDHALVAELVAVLKQAKAEAWSVAQVRAALAPLKPALAAAEAESAWMSCNPWSGLARYEPLDPMPIIGSGRMSIGQTRRLAIST